LEKWFATQGDEGEEMSGEVDVMIEVEPLAEQVAKHLSAKTLGQVRGQGDSVALKKIFCVSNIVRFYRMGCNPERWLGQTEELLEAKKFLGMPTIEEQKKILVEKGFMREPGEEG
jgi:hypothetical protein